MEEIQKWLGHSSIRTTERYDAKDENGIKKEQLSNGNQVNVQKHFKTLHNKFVKYPKLKICQEICNFYN